MSVRWYLKKGFQKEKKSDNLLDAMDTTHRLPYLKNWNASKKYDYDSATSIKLRSLNGRSGHRNVFMHINLSIGMEHNLLSYTLLKKLQFFRIFF